METTHTRYEGINSFTESRCERGDVRRDIQEHTVKNDTLKDCSTFSGLMDGDISVWLETSLTRSQKPNYVICDCGE